MRTRRLRWLVLLLVTGCGDSSAMDASIDSLDAAMPTVDAGADAGVPPRMDAGSDAGFDGGAVEAGSSDAGAFACDPATLTTDDYVDGILNAWCAYDLRCATHLGELSRFILSFCHPTAFGAGYDTYRAELASGVLTFDPLAACRCLAEFYRPTCDTLVNHDIVSACAPVVSHAVPPTTCDPGAPCDFGQYCDGADFVCPSAPPGSCLPAPMVGDACDSVCWLGSACIDGMCQRYSDVGEPCSLTTPAVGICQGGLYCDAGRCRGRGALGETCSPPVFCEAGLVCSDGRCESGRPLGASCRDDDRCALGLRCEGGSCFRAAGPGELCASPEECPPGFACDGTCRARPTVGEPCPSGDCWLGTCTAGTCVLSPNGAACEGPLYYLAQCQGHCDLLLGTCLDRVGPGGACRSRYDCVSEYTCSAGECVAACMP